MGKRKKKNSLKDVRNLKATSFIERYYGISHENIANMTHDTIKIFFPQLQRTSFEYIQKNPELVSTGQIILVEDAKHYQVPYLAPSDSEIELTLGCDNRELVIQKIVKLFSVAVGRNLNALCIIEGDDSLDNYTFQQFSISDSLLEEDSLLESMERATENDSGIIISADYSLKGYRFLGHGDNCYSTMVLPSLQRQAIGISKRTDAIGIVYENGVFAIMIDGTVKPIFDKNDLQKNLMRLFPIPKEIPREREVNVIVNSPSAYTLSEMNVYELEQLMRVYRASNQDAYYHIVRRELIRRTRHCKGYKIAKQKQKQKMLEEGDY